jgi:hypothetical protein
MSYGMLGFESLINERFVICDYVYEVQSCLLSQMQRLKLCLIVYSLSARSSILQANNTWPFFERFFYFRRAQRVPAEKPSKFRHNATKRQVRWD